MVIGDGVKKIKCPWIKLTYRIYITSCTLKYLYSIICIIYIYIVLYIRILQLIQMYTEVAI